MNILPLLLEYLKNVSLSLLKYVCFPKSCHGYVFSLPLTMFNGRVYKSPPGLV